MAVSAKYLDGSIGTETANRFMNKSEGVGIISATSGIMSNEKEQVNWFIKIDGIEKPLLLDHVRGFDNL